MKTRLLIIIGLVVISAIVISYSYGNILFDEYYEIEITGLKDTYTTDEVYSFDYHITGIGDSCAEITVMYPDENGETLTSGSMPQCAAERNLRVIIDQSSFQGPLGNIAIKIPGTYKISVTYDPIGSLLSAITTKQFEVIDDFEETWGGPGNRHPAFLGYEIPESCTEDMIKHLVRYSNMFFADEENFSSEWIGLPENVNLDDYDVCVDDLLKLREISRENHDDIAITEFPEPPTLPESTQCKPGLPPFTSDYYLDRELCKWKLIPEPAISEAIPYVWNAHLQKRQIDFLPLETSYINADEGYFIEKETRVCSPLILSDGTELYISSTFTIEPFEIINTVMSEIQPDDCHKIWKTDALLVEPSPELGAWLENYWELENEK